jgi:DnaK suppressor protein
MRDDLCNGYRPSEDEDYMCKNHSEYFRKKLLAWRKEIIMMSEVFLEDLKENGIKHADIIDQSASQTEILIDFSERERQGRLLQEIDLALDRIEQGTYGYCEITGEDIGIKRLDAQPIATRCIEAQEEFEQAANARYRAIAVY